MTSPEITAGRRSRILGLAASLLATLTLVGAAAQPSSAANQDPPPVSCITDHPVDPLGPGFVFDRAEFTTIDHPDAVLETAPFGINNRGHVVGYYLDADQVRHGFLLRNGTYTTIDHPLASSDTQAHDLNDRGQIVGLYERRAGQTVEVGDAAETAPNRVGDIGSALSPFASLWTGVDGFQ